MGKGKLAKFADMERYENVFQYPFSVADNVPFDMKGHWRETYFKNQNPIVLELGCGKGEYTVGLAKMFPDINFIGVDIKGARMWTGATGIGRRTEECGVPTHQHRDNRPLLQQRRGAGDMAHIQRPADEEPAQAPHIHILPRALSPLPHRRRNRTPEDRLELPLHLHHLYAAAQQPAAALPHRGPLSYRRSRSADKGDSEHPDLLRVDVDRTWTEHQIHEVQPTEGRRADRTRRGDTARRISQLSSRQAQLKGNCKIN